VKAPEGTQENQFVLVTDNYMLKTEIKPKKKRLLIGDAVEFAVTQKADAVPDILLQPVTYRSNEYFRVYGKEPMLKRGLTGDFDVSRTDRFTFVATAEGNVTLAAQTRVWWNSKTKKVHDEKIPELTFEIIPDPQIAIDAKRVRQKKVLLYIVIVLLILFALYKTVSPYLKKYLSERRIVYEKSEKGKYEKLLKRIEEENISEIYNDFYDWLDLASPELSKLGFRGIVTFQPSFKEALAEFEETLLVPDQAFDRQGFMRQLGVLREVLLRQKEPEYKGLPKTINPI
jgi:hypothetical protein